MKIITPDFYKQFHCIASRCPDSCCRQGWQISVDEEHLELYASLPGDLGSRVRDALTEEDGDTVFRMEHGICKLLDEDGLCALAREHGEESLCHLCHTHPRFIEGYGGTKEIHLSLQCPEAARLTLLRVKPIAYETAFSDEAVVPCDIDPEEYTALLQIRKFCLSLCQARSLPVNDRIALLLRFAGFAQNLLDRQRYDLCKPLCRKFRDPVFWRRQLRSLTRKRLQGTSFFAEVTLLRSLEHLTEEFPRLLHSAVFTARSSKDFDRSCALQMEHLIVIHLAHYIPKAVNDGRVDTKIFLAALLSLAARRFAVCTGKETPEDLCHFAGLLAKEIEHSEENMAALYACLSQPGWQMQLASQLDLQKGE